MEISEIKKWITEWFVNNSSINKNFIIEKEKSNYFEEGWIDSFKFVSFIMDIENNFNISFSNDEFQNRGFSTINGLSKIISERVNDKKI